MKLFSKSATQNRLASLPGLKLGLLGLGLVAVVGLITLVILNWNTPATTPSSSPTTASTPTNPQIENKWGVRVSRLGVTADGGMVDFRFVVTDPDKALELMSKIENLPILATEKDHTYIKSAALMSPRHALNPGLTYFVLYRNTNGAVKPGTAVTVLFPDELKLEHVVAQ